jgi:putative YhdH/YhfP family quinone oxidoreductase
MRAFVISGSDEVTTAIADVPEPQGDVVIAVHFSSINFKDAMAVRPRSTVRRRDPLIGGVDAAGVVHRSSHSSLAPGTPVVVHGGGIGTSEDGGFAEFLATTPERVTELPTSLSPREAMILGTAGYTAAASVLALQQHGVTPGDGEILVTGATGGVGSLAVRFLAVLGYTVVASTGSTEEASWLRGIGATTVIGRDEIRDRPDRVLATPRWAGAVDCVGGKTLSDILASLKWGAPVAASGLVGSATFEANVYPFITRNVALLGIDSVDVPAKRRADVWHAAATWSQGLDLEDLVDCTIGLNELPEHLARIDRGATRGRVVVDVSR